MTKNTVPQGHICKHCGENIHQISSGRYVKSGGLNWALCEKHEPEA